MVGSYSSFGLRFIDDICCVGGGLLQVIILKHLIINNNTLIHFCIFKCKTIIDNDKIIFFYINICLI